jgi:hypothetical protein
MQLQMQCMMELFLLRDVVVVVVVAAAAAVVVEAVSATVLVVVVQTTSNVSHRIKECCLNMHKRIEV